MKEKWMSANANHLFSLSVAVSAVLIASAISVQGLISIISVLLISILVLVRSNVPVRIPVR
jgi:hypothetical protein